MENVFTDNAGFGIPRWRMPLALSFIIHFLIALTIFLIPAQKEKEKTLPIVAQLITPDELKQKIPILPQAPAPPKTAPIPQMPMSRSIPKGLQQSKPVIVPKTMPEPSVQIPSDIAGSEKGAEMNVGQKEAALPKTSPPASSVKKSPEKAVPAIPLREKLFDREIIGNIAKKDEAKTEKGITFDTKEFRHQTYMKRLKERIEGVWQYPNDAAKRGIYGDLFIRFTIKKDGTLGNVELIRTSGHKSLDDAAMRALRDAEPFWPLPDEWEKDAIVIDGYFIYSIYGVYIR